jgi:D-arabinose 1-dehydrogenase-like Zn-dependent alcohol dehydrogenase
VLHAGAANASTRKSTIRREAYDRMLRSDVRYRFVIDAATL